MQHSGFDGLTAWQNGISHRKLSRIGFEFLGDPFQMFGLGQKAYPFHIAQKFKIPLKTLVSARRRTLDVWSWVHQ